jgi:cytochrome c oxidase subunit 4
MADTTHPHHSSARTYVLIFVALLALTASTVWVANVELGPWHAAAALAIAAAKATLIVLFFMHGLESSRLVHLVVLGALLWLAIMISFTYWDYSTRDLDRRIRTGEPAEVKGAPR